MKLKNTILSSIIAGLISFSAYSQSPGQPGGERSGAAGDSLSADSLEAAAQLIFIPPDSMILIPGGEYLIGNDDDLKDQRPRHKVVLKAFFIDNHEVTNEQYERFTESANHRLPYFWQDTTLNKPSLPVTGISWEDAKAYCEWRGGRLPTEAEWEAAAGGGLKNADYPWEGAPSGELANYIFDPDEDPLGIKIVGQYPPNGYGLYDMAGNVYEWVNDYYSQTFYADSTSWKFPNGPEKGDLRVIRGGSWNYTEEFMQIYRRNKAKPDTRFRYIGFRCAKDAE